VQTTQGNIDSALLDLPRLNLTELPASADHAHSHPVKQGLAALSLPEHQRWRRNLNSGQGYQACGWILMPIPFLTPSGSWSGPDLRPSIA
jgi:hypothetical protein